MAPGVGHCGGGAGPDVFGQSPEIPAADAKEDILAALDRWSESGQAPESVLARKYEGESPLGGHPPANTKPIASRPLCAYPKVAVYKGTGDAADGNNLACTPTAGARYERPAPEYLKQSFLVERSEEIHEPPGSGMVRRLAERSKEQPMALGEFTASGWLNSDEERVDV
jgi:hypothetical protein